MNLQSVKTRFGIVGSSTGLERALATATVGLVSKVEFARRREELEKAAEEGHDD